MAGCQPSEEDRDFPIIGKPIKSELNSAGAVKRPDELEMRVPADAARALSSRPPGERGPVRLQSGGARWWAETSPVPLGPQRRLALRALCLALSYRIRLSANW